MNRLVSAPLWCLLTILALPFAGCDDDSGNAAADAAAPDAMPRPDAMIRPDFAFGPDAMIPDVEFVDAEIPDSMIVDAEIPDAEPADMAIPDADLNQVPLMGFGAIEGECGVLEAMDLESPLPSMVINSIDFGADPYDEADKERLTMGGQTIVSTENAGGSSVLSEAFAFEVLARCELAHLLKTELEIEYDYEEGMRGSITDILVEIEDLKVGVSVVRAVGFPREAPYTVEQASAILTRKLEGILESSANVAIEDAWVKQILHVIAYAPGHVESIQAAWNALDPGLRADTIVWVTVSEGVDDFLY